MRILVVGAGWIGANVLLQLKKNSKIEVLTVDPREAPYAVQAGIVSRIDFREALNPLTLGHVINQVAPDLVLVTTTAEDMELGQAPGLDVFVEALRKELASIVDVPVIGVPRL